MAHHPRHRLADLEIRIGRRGDHARVPARRVSTVRNPLVHLHQRLLNMARLGAIGEVGVEVRIAEFASEPRAVPEQEGEQYQREREQDDQ